MSEEQKQEEQEELPKELKELIDKLPTKFGEPNANANPKHTTLDIINDEDFSYKVLYCVDLNQKDNEKISTMQIYNDIIPYYNVKKKLLDISLGTVKNKLYTTITFDEGFFVNINPKKGGSTPTQKRRPKRQKKTNNTIRMRTR
jgi:hypothetical protein